MDADTPKGAGPVRVLAFAVVFKQLLLARDGRIDPEQYLSTCARLLGQEENEALRMEVTRLFARHHGIEEIHDARPIAEGDSSAM